MRCAAFARTAPAPAPAFSFRTAVAFTFSTGINRGHEAAPLVVGDTMYVVTPFPNILYALDLTPGNAGGMRWKYEPKPAAAAQGVA